MINHVMKQVIILMLLLAAVSLAEQSDDWTLFKEEHNKSYSSDAEELVHRAAYMKSKEFVDTFKDEDGCYTVALNTMADRTDEEMHQSGGLRSASIDDKYINNPEGLRKLENILKEDLDELPANFDWRLVQGRVTGVKNQGE